MSGARKAPATLPNGLAWAAQAACADEPLALFFSESQASVEQAKEICGWCPVRTRCLTEVLRAEDGSRFGIYGGLTPSERSELVATNAAQRAAGLAAAPLPDPPKTGRKLAPCGTRAAYQRHVKKREPIDEPCRAANTAADRRLRTTGSTQARK